MLTRNTHYLNGEPRKLYYFDQDTKEHWYLRWDGSYFITSVYIDPIKFEKSDDAEFAAEVGHSVMLYRNKLDQIDRQIAQERASQREIEPDNDYTTSDINNPN